MTATDDLLRNNEAYADRFDKADLPHTPVKKVAVVACMDTRLIPTRVLGLEEGEAHVIRNAGGVVTDDVIRSLAISQNILGTEEIVLLHHTRCGLLDFTDDQFVKKMKDETGQEPDWPVHTFSDLEGDVREGIRKLQDSPFIPNKGSIRGFVYDVETGRVREVKP